MYIQVIRERVEYSPDGVLREKKKGREIWSRNVTVHIRASHNENIEIKFERFDLRVYALLDRADCRRRRIKDSRPERARVTRFFFFYIATSLVCSAVLICIFDAIGDSTRCEKLHEFRFDLRAIVTIVTALCLLKDRFGQSAIRNGTRNGIFFIGKHSKRVRILYIYL